MLISVQEHRKNTTNCFIAQNLGFLKVPWVRGCTPGWLKILSNHSGNRTYDLRNASHVLYRLSYAVRTVRYCDISELGLVLSIPDTSKCIIPRSTQLSTILFGIVTPDLGCTDQSNTVQYTAKIAQTV